ncbi:ATP-binding protein [Streptomyces sp. KR80]|uniref:ATP-binding protein n=1 Tax=Streptomyces sp. KR80 TaxID=3457426 RepID=UPI003FCF40E3
MSGLGDTVPPTGRGLRLAQLQAAIRAVASGSGGFVLVDGEPGAGKSHLLSAGVAEAARLGLRIHRGSADDLGRDLPLSALLDCLRGHPRCAEVVELLGGEPPRARVAAAVARITDLVLDLCAEAPLVLVLDDLQWADEASLLVWHRLSRNAEGLPLLLVGARRPVPRRLALDRLAQSLREQGGLLIRLEPLTAEETRRLVVELQGASGSPQLLDRVLALAGGNPRYVRELVTAPAGPDPDGRSAPPAVLRAVAGTLGFLSPAAFDVLRTAALLEADVTVRELVALTGRPARELLPVVEEIIAASLLDATGESLAFRHGVVREALLAGLPDPLRSALHRDAARTLAEARAQVTRVAEQLLAAPEATDGWVTAWLVEHAEALAVQAPALAAALLQRTVDRMEHSDPDRGCLEEHLGAAAFALRRPESAALVRTLRDRAPEPGRRASLTALLVRGLVQRGSFAEALNTVEEALQEPSPSPQWSVRFTALRALALAYLDRYAEAEEVAGTAVARAEALGDPVTRAQAQHSRSMALLRLRRTAEAVTHMAAGIEASRDSPEAADLRLHLLLNQADTLDALDRPPEARRALEEARELARCTGSTNRLAGVDATSAVLAFWSGHWEQAEADLAAARSRQTADAWMPVLVHGMSALILGHRDRRTEARRSLGLLGDRPLAPGDARANSACLLLARALLAERDGSPAQALEALAPALITDYAADLSLERSRLLPDTVRLALDTGNAERARAAMAACASDAAAEPGHEGLRAAAARCRGLFEQDPDRLREAVTYYEAVSRPLLLGQSLEDLAVALAWRGALDDARDSLGRAVDVYLSLGAGWDIARADARLRPLGVRRGRRSARRRATRGWEALTPTESKVALLVAEGRSNPEIASELFLSRRTVQTHVSHILAKLEVRSRTEVAREVTVRQPSG